MKLLLPGVVLLLAVCPFVRAADDILVADFEGPTYGDWKTEGEAFGPGPAQGTLPNQMPVSGFEGHGLVNSYFNGDGSVGTLTSPPITIQRRYLKFLIGGGFHPGQTCMNLISDGKVVRTATGPNDRPGGTERLDWQSWDVADLAGKAVTLQIVDQYRGGWGHINIDDIIQSDRPAGMVGVAKTVRLDRNFVSFQLTPPVGELRPYVTLMVGNRIVRGMIGPIAGKSAWFSWEVQRFRGQRAVLQATEPEAPDGKRPVSSSLTQSDQAKGIAMIYDTLYKETYRPQFHFTAQKGWLNDPNGLVFYKGEYHLFFQHNPEGTDWGNMTWGHAVSTDLVHWKQLDNAIHPDKLGTIFSGSAVIDWNNTTGFATGAEKPLVCIYTSAGDTSPESKGQPFTQSIAYSIDRGRTFTKYEHNPVLAHIIGGNRDPKVIWHEPSKRWVMALYLDGNDYALFTSPDLKTWTKACDVPAPGASECPDFFELPVDGDANNIKWVFWGANGLYLLGTFDGTTFTPESGPEPSLWGANFYAAQTYSDIPAKDGRRIQIGWMNGGQYPDMPFNQQMTFPCVLTLRTTPEGIRLFREPVQEIEKLHGTLHGWIDQAIEPEQNALAKFSGELFDIRAEIDPGKASEVVLTVRGTPIRYDAKEKTLTCMDKSAKLEPVAGKIRLQALVDRTSIEIFGNGGAITMAYCFLPDPADQSLSLTATGGTAKATSLKVWEMKRAW
jgi:sucrose-6-phosphate hydrolase SacC (GH32 family)